MSAAPKVNKTGLNKTHLNDLNSMKHLKIYGLLVAALLLTCRLQAQDAYAATLLRINREITAATVKGDAEGLLHFYAQDAVLMPEYHPTLFGKKAITEYIEHWLDWAKMDYYDRKSVDITRVGDYLVETGLFQKRYTWHHQTIAHAGKYLAVWRISAPGDWQLVSEISGADKNLKRSEVPLSELVLPDTTLLPKPPQGKTQKLIQTLNDSLSRLVLQRRGADFAAYYWDDALFGPYYWPLLTQKRAIDAYYQRHEDPNTGMDQAHTAATRIYETGAYVLVDGYFSFDWNGDQHRTHRTVTGKSITLWKRGGDGRVRIYRQVSVLD